MAQDAVGYWQGTLTISATLKLRAGVSIERGADGTLTGTFDSPDQNAFGIPLAGVELADGKLTFDIPPISGRFEGTWDPSTQAWNGTFNQGGGSLPLVLTAGEAPERTPPAPLPADWTIPGDAALGELLDERIAQRAGAGMVLGVIEPAGTRIVARGPAGGPKFDGDTVFEIGSMTKVFTALLLADMALKGEVSLDDPVEKYLPEGAGMPVRNGKAITLRHLTMQNSGLPRLPDNMPYADPLDPYADYTEQHLLDFLGRYELPRDPGAEYEYSNLGVGLLGYVLTRAAGKDYEALVRERILDPLGMHDTAITLDPGMHARFAMPHDEFMRQTKPWTLPVLAGAGALRSTASDMLRFLAAALDPQSPLAPAMALTLAERLGEADKRQTALGWMVGHPPTGEIVFHGGGTGGFRSFMVLQPNKNRAVVALTNSAIEPSAEDVALHAIIGLPVAEAGPVPEAPPAAAPRQEVALTSGQLDHVAGTYQLTPQIQIVVRREGERLMAQLTGQPPFPIFPESPLSFFWKVVDAQIRFTEEDGVVTGAVFSQNGQTIEIAKVD
ncbi:MAG: serine hydrolase [Croceibacterium sp.]